MVERKLFCVAPGTGMDERKMGWWGWGGGCDGSGDGVKRGCGRKVGVGGTKPKIPSTSFGCPSAGGGGV